MAIDRSGRIESKVGDRSGSSLIIADDHPIYRGGLRRALTESPGFDVLAEFGDGIAALDGIRSLVPDLAIVDLRLPGLDGIAVAEATRRERIETRVVIVSAYEDKDTVFNAFNAGAWAYLSKLVPAEDISETLARVAAGKRVVPKEFEALLSTSSDHKARRSSTVLSAREREVLKLTAEGMSAPEIAEHLFVGVTTVKTHLQHIYEKFNVSDRAAAVAQAHRRGLLEQ